MSSTLGYTTAGNEASTGLDLAAALKVTMPAGGGTVSKMTTYVQGSSTFGTNYVQGKIYDSNLDEVANGETAIETIGNDAAWLDLDFSTEPTLSAGDYYIDRKSVV